MIIVTNSFSLNMVDLSHLEFKVRMQKISASAAAWLLNRKGFVSAIGHGDTSVIVSNLLGVHVPENRTTVTMGRGTLLLVCQYRGPRLPEGATTLPEGASIEFVLVEISVGRPLLGHLREFEPELRRQAEEAWYKMCDTQYDDPEEYKNAENRWHSATAMRNSLMLGAKS